MNITLENGDKITLRTSFDTFQIMNLILKREARLDCSTKEHLWVISLNQYKKILNIELVGMGSIKQVAASPPEVYSLPVHKKATSVVLVHNHPSGSLVPSQADRDVTNRLIQAGLLLDIEVHDHLILVENSYYSFKDSGLLKELEMDPKYALTFTREKLLKRNVEKKVTEIKKKFKKEKLNLIKKLIKKGKMSLREISDITGMPYNWVVRINNETEEKTN